MIISNIKVYDNLSNEDVFNLACKKNKIDISKVVEWHILKKSVDARKKDDIHFSYSLDLLMQGEKREEKKNLLLVDNKKILDKRPVVVGAGPAGLFAAYTLALNGYNPILLEQGKSIEEREKDVEEFINNRKLNPNSNIQFGEGGAGTFSDGKLTTNINSDLNKTVLETFVKFGAPEEIMYLSKPHIGTDNLRKLVKSMREEIIRLGGEVRFNTKVVDFECSGDHQSSQTIQAVITNTGDRIETNTTILAIGHSARSTFEKLKELGVRMEPKPFSVGVRIEHLQSDINNAQYGSQTKLNLPPAEYKMAYHGEDGRSCYTFCMCPGGFVMASSSDEGEIVTNGMSYFDRSGENANSALLVNITPEDYMKDDNPLNGVYFQKELEQKAFKMAGSNYNAPVQRVGDYIGNGSDDYQSPQPTYKPGITYCNLNDLFPDYINKTLKNGIKYFGAKLNGFDKNDALLTAVESRSSSPVRIIRGDAMNASISGVFPCGEGAGYAGGIMTSAIDGIKVAKKIIKNH
ncbi:MAG: hypothetical protein IKR04_07965 [Clostridia bacterium]|nr:hypothetical protein [Clostridia bacterium]